MAVAMAVLTHPYLELTDICSPFIYQIASLLGTLTSEEGWLCLLWCCAAAAWCCSHFRRGMKELGGTLTSIYNRTLDFHRLSKAKLLYSFIFIGQRGIMLPGVATRTQPQRCRDQSVSVVVVVAAGAVVGTW